MKYDHTDDKNIKRHPKSGIYYFKRGKIEESLKTDVWKEALLRKQFKLAELDAAGTVAFKFTVNDIYPRYLAERETEGLRAGTLTELRALFNLHLLPFFGDHRLYKISSPAWSKYCFAKRGMDLSNHRKVFQGFLKWCKRRGYLQALPDISEIPTHVRRRRRAARPEELTRIFEHCDGSLKVFLALALYNGLRRSEIMTLRWENISFEQQFLVIIPDFNKPKRRREIPFNDVVLRVLERRYAEIEGGSPWVFPHRDDQRQHADKGGLKTAWGTCLRRAGITNLTWHDLRATYEKYAHKSTEHTDTQREKFADASSEVQKRIYVTMDHTDLKGLESVVQVPGLDALVIRGLGENEGR